MLIPSIALLAIGVGASVYLVDNGRDATKWAGLARATTGPAVDHVKAFQAERLASMLHLAGDPTAAANLPALRKDSDTALAIMYAQGDAAVELRPDTTASIEGFQQLFDQLPVLRGGIDARALPPDQAFGAFTMVIETIVGSTLLAAEVAPSPEVALDLYHAMIVLRASESLSKTTTLGAVALSSGVMTPEQLAMFSHYVGETRGMFAHSTQLLTGPRAEQLKALIASPEWQKVAAMEDAVALRGVVTPDDRDSSSASSSSSSSSSSGSRQSTQDGTTTALPMTITDWTTTASALSGQLTNLWLAICYDAQDAASADGESTERNSIWGGVAISSVSLLAFLSALFLANRLIARMHRLRRETLELADERLPDTMRRLGDGKKIDSSDLAPLDFGTDEIGQVADAFNRAHSAAVSAAVAESKTRTGVNAVFLNIAHRSQVIVHRQLALLDRAEREEENPGKLDVLFQLDHLATRARRNAENLIILGGEKPGRRWRNPVPLMDVVRSAVAESLDYTRIQTGKLPEVRIQGSSVADLIHLLAELTDNATAYSPPESRVEITGTVVGRGVALSISDQGLGMSADELAERNALLADPPDFSVAALSSDARLGLFVVGKLAARHGISVRLSESDYGGVRAIVLVPTSLISDDESPSGSADRGEELDRRRQRAAIPAAPTPPAVESAHTSMSAAPSHYEPSPPQAPMYQPPAQQPPPYQPPTYQPPAAPAPVYQQPDPHVYQPPTAPFQSVPDSYPAQPSYVAPTATGTHQAPVYDYATQSFAIPQQAAPQPAAPAPTPAAGDKPALPRRKRTTANAEQDKPASVATTRARSADEARSLMSAIENGTRQGRLKRVDINYPSKQYDRQEGAGDDLQTP